MWLNRVSNPGPLALESDALLARPLGSSHLSQLLWGRGGASSPYPDPLTHTFSVSIVSVLNILVSIL